MKKKASSYASAAGPPAAAAPVAAAAPPKVHFGSLVSTVEGGKLSSGPSRATFDVFGVDLCVVNAMRRGVMADVPTVAIAFEPTASKTERDAGIQFFKNTGVLHNEFLGHRISMVPLGFEERQVAGFDPAQYKFVLKKKNQGDEVVDVTTGDFVVQDVAGAELKDLTALVFPPSPITGDHVLLARLKPGANNDGDGEEISLEARARLGTGREHARWSPVSACFFRYKVDPAAFEASLKVKLDALGPTATEADRTRVRSQHAALDGLRDFAKNEHGEPVAFEFTIASESRLRPAYLVQQSFRALSDKVRRLSTGVQRDAVDAANRGVGASDADDDSDADADTDMHGGWGGATGGAARGRRAKPVVGANADADADADAGDMNVRVRALANMEDFYEVAVRDEDHTLGNMVQGLLYRHWVREGGANDVSFIGYHQPHPLEGEIVFKVKCAKAGGDVRALLVDGLAWVVGELNGLADEWDRLAGFST
jgi:DNA-directed RNA polymerase II subunit RPB3